MAYPTYKFDVIAWADAFPPIGVTVATFSEARLVVTALKREGFTVQVVPCEVYSVPDALAVFGVNVGGSDV